MQGDADGLTKLNLIVDKRLATPFLAECSRRGWGVDLSAEDLQDLWRALAGPANEVPRIIQERIPMLLFADHYWLLAKSKVHLTRMTMFGFS